jgi:hypothetical protein
MKNPSLLEYNPLVQLKVSRRFGGICRVVSDYYLHVDVMFCLLFGSERGSNLFLRNSVDLQWKTCRYVTEDRTLER